MTSPPSSEAQSLALRILIVDDHAIVREGLKRMLEATAPRWKVDATANGQEALEQMRQAEYDVAIVDISMPGMSGLDLLRHIRAEFPAVRVLMLSMYAEEQYAVRAFKAGATGYLTKDSATRELVAAVRKLVSGGVYVSANLAERLVLSLNSPAEDPRHAHLTDRELEVLRRLAAGNRPAEIAQALHISAKTVSTHKTRILERLQLPNTAALIRYALEHDLVPGAIESEPSH
jgi:DNA-binding NarL/FixJ family response regulator